MRMPTAPLAAILAGALLGMMGCAEDLNPLPSQGDRVQALFDPAARILPAPTDLARNQQTSLLAVPVADEATQPAQAAFDRYLNTLDGFPTSSTATACFSGKLQSDAAALRDAVKVFELGDADAKELTDEITVTGPIESPDCPVLSQTPCDPTQAESGCDAGKGQRCVATDSSMPTKGLCATSGYKLLISNTHGWAAASRYAIAVVSGLKDDAGNNVIPAATFSLLVGDEPLCAWSDAEAKCTYNYAALITSTVRTQIDADFPDLGEQERKARIAEAELATATDLERLRAGVIDPLIRATGVARNKLLLIWGFSTRTQVEAVFDPSAERIPGLGNDLLLDPSTGQLRDDVPLPAKLLPGLKQLGGFSTTATYWAEFSGALDPETVKAGTDLLLVNLSDQAKQPLATFEFDAKLNVVKVTPATPLEEGSRYAVIMVSKRKGDPLTVESGGGLADPDGRRVVPSPTMALVKSSARLVDDEGKSTVSVLSDAQAAQLEPLRQGYDQLLGGLESSPLKLAREDVVMVWTFTTQKFSSKLTQLRAAALGALQAVDGGKPVLSGLHDTDFNSWPAGFPRSNIAGYVANGVFNSWRVLDPQTDVLLADPTTGAPMDVPFLLTTPKDLPNGQPCTAAGGANPCDEGKTCVTMVGGAENSVPLNSCMPNAGFPVVIFQHGLNRTKGDVHAVANALAGAGFATIAFDVIFHGERSHCTSNAHCVENATCDRAHDSATRGLCCVDSSCNRDYFADVDGPDGQPDGVPDATGVFFLNAANPFAITSNIWQHVVDSAALTRTLRAGGVGLSNVVQVGPPPVAPAPVQFKLDPARIHYVGVSLGSILGVLTLAVDPLSTAAEGQPRQAVLSVPGAPATRIFQESPNPEFQAFVAGLLAANGAQPGSMEELQLFHILQWIFDGGDAANYARYVDNVQLEDVFASAVAKQHVPVPKNNVLVQVAGKDQVIPTALQMGLAGWLGVDVSKSTYPDAEHSFLLTSADENKTTAAAQTQMVRYLLNSDDVCQPKPSAATCE